MISELYSGQILDAAASIPAAARLECPAATAKKVSRVCGSEVEVDLNIDNHIVTEFGMTAKACALGQASASIVARNIIGATPEELLQLRADMKAMLKENGAPPAGERWRDLAMLAPLRDYPQRHASVMLIFEAVAACLGELGFDQAAD